MEFEAKTIRLKDGREAILRCPQEEDIPGILEYLRVTAAETEFLLQYPEECGKYTYEGAKALYEKIKASPTDLMLACFVDGKVAGNCQLTLNNRLKMRHRGSVAIALRKEFWNLGIGSAMFEELIRAAKTHPEVRQLELEFIEGNSRARALYEKFGFRIAGMHPDAIRLKDGTMLAEYLMIKSLERDEA
ncbi:MAG: GNAT family N-acetyltransferase [Lachnospiraceae bacterium]|nr:GNAT family N-acetyltransferase [Lachnospiraceae bacterium]